MAKAENIDWRNNPDRVGEVRRLLEDEGVSYAEAGKRLGVDRHVISGVVMRYGIVPKPDPNRPYVRRSIVVLAPARDPAGNHYTALTISDATCKWPLGDVGPDLIFCANHPADKSPYCPRHTEKARAKPQNVERVQPREFARIDLRLTKNHLFRIATPGRVPDAGTGFATLPRSSNRGLPATSFTAWRRSA